MNVRQETIDQGRQTIDDGPLTIDRELRDQCSSSAVRHLSSIFLLYSLALLLRLGAVFLLGVPDPVQASEDGMIAGRLVSGQGYTFDLYGYRADAPLQSYMPPLYVLFVAFFLRFWSPIGLGIVQAMLSSLMPLLVYSFAKRTAGAEVGGPAAAAVAVYPVFLIQAARPFTLTLLSLLLMTWLVALTSAWTRTRPWRWAAVGVLAGLAALVRTPMLGLVAISLMTIALHCRALPAPRRAVASVLVGAMLIVAPWVMRNVALHRASVLISTNGGFTFWNGNNPFTTGSAFDVYLERAAAYLGRPVNVNGQTTGIAHLRPYPLPHEVEPVVSRLSEVELDRAFYRAGLAFIREHPRQWLALLVRKIISFWWFRPHIGQSRADLGPGGVIYQQAWIRPYKLLYAVVFPLFVGGLILSWEAASVYAPVYLLLIYLTGVYAAFNVTTRYRWEIEPLILLFATLAVWRAIQAVQERMGEEIVSSP